MTQITQIPVETDLKGTLINATLTSTGLTAYVQFIDSKTGAARTPQATTLLFTIDKDNDKSETILADSHSTSGGVTTITINSAGRAIPKYGVGAGGATGNEHVIGAEVGCVNIARPLNVIANEMLSKQVGGTIQGPVDFSGATTTFRLPNLTEVQRDALASPANGMKIYNTTAGEEQVYNGGTWYTLATGSTQPDASATVAGKVEIATAAEIAAGTGTGGTGAVIVPSPDNLLTFLFRPGMMLPYGGAAAPTGWLLCDGSAVSRVTYAALFAIIGEAYGAGDGSTTFNVPDSRGKALYGKAASGTYGALGGTGGAETKDLSHTHALGVAAGVELYAAGNQLYWGQGTTAGNFTAIDSLTATAATGTGAQTGHALYGATNSGASATQDVTNPFLVVNHIIKT